MDRALRDRDAAPVLDGYRGFATPDRLILRGRVLSASRRTAPLPDQGRWANLRQMLSLFLTDEVADVAVEARGVTTRSDGEGYVWLEVPREGEGPGWHDVEVGIVGDDGPAVPFPVMVPERQARIGIISDIDDTMMKTGAYSLARNLWTTFTGSALTRKVFPDAVVLMDHLHAHGLNPVYYVSSSPWNLHYFLDKVFARAGLVAGPMFLRDFGVGTAQGGANAHGDHKGDAILQILAANPDLPFILMGDTGQHDAEIYHGICERAGGQVRAVILREATRNGPGDAARHAIAAMRIMGVTVHTGRDFTGAADALDHAGVDVQR
ncbi:App1 family protein [Oceaniglobus indicus]|uniref:App1 family protein n=1 Tax=Oceaniglobus indicus TaxID=2047749 RepID=UPI000C195946|nr:phosphatase domain-containing protein [Oceaniglobus indicus]